MTEKEVLEATRLLINQTVKNLNTILDIIEKLKKHNESTKKRMCLIYDLIEKVITKENKEEE